MSDEQLARLDLAELLTAVRRAPPVAAADARRRSCTVIVRTEHLLLGLAVRGCGISSEAAA
jgi:hypothetical protein